MARRILASRLWDRRRGDAPARGLRRGSKHHDTSPCAAPPRRGPVEPDPSGVPPIPPGGPGVWPIHVASGVGYGEGFESNAHRHVPDGWLPASEVPGRDAWR